MVELIVLENTPIARDTYRLRLRFESRAVRAPGQFMQLAVEGMYLRRPLSICDWDAESITHVYKVVGAGTERMTRWTQGQCADALGPFGNGFDTEESCSRPLLVGGGVGVPPLVGLARALRAKGLRPQAALGFRTRADALLLDAFERLGVPVHVATEDGSLGAQGYVTGLLPDLSFDQVFACGPMPMRRAVARATDARAQFSLEARMGCGFGACMGCSIETNAGMQRVCKDGPVFRREELPWLTRA